MRQFQQSKHEIVHRIAIDPASQNRCASRSGKARQPEWDGLLGFFQSGIKRGGGGIPPQKQKGLIAMLDAVRIKPGAWGLQKALVAKTRVVLLRNQRDIANFSGKPKTEARANNGCDAHDADRQQRERKSEHRIRLPAKRDFYKAKCQPGQNGRDNEGRPDLREVWIAVSHDREIDQ